MKKNNYFILIMSTMLLQIKKIVSLNLIKSIFMFFATFNQIVSMETANRDLS